MKNTILQLPDYLENYITEAKATEITVAFKDTHILVACRCVIANKHYTASVRCRLRDKMSVILRKITSCLDEIRDTYLLENSITPAKTNKSRVRKQVSKPEPVEDKIESKPVKDTTVKETSKDKPKRSHTKDSPTFMVAGVTLQTLSGKVRVNRYARKLSIKQYAKKLGISPSTLWYLEKCERMPRKPEVVRRILDYTNGKTI